MDSNQIRHITSAIFGLYVPTKFERFGTKLREISAKADQNSEQILVTPTRKTVWAIVFKLLSVTHLPSKVDRFEFLINWSNIVCIMTHEKTRCKIHITHLMIIGVC